MTRGRVLLGVGLVAVVAIAGVAAPPSWRNAEAAGADASALRPSRVFVLSLPALTWADVRAHSMPNLERLLASSAVADLTTRAVKRTTSLGDGYTTLGAGTRAEGIETQDGFGFGVDERFGSDPAGAVYRVRTGRDPGDGLVDLGIGAIVAHNDSLLYDAHVGALGDALARAGYRRAVIANGDGEEPQLDAATYRRHAVAALMGSDGKVPAGRVDAGLLRPDPAAPFGVRLDQAAVTAAFDRVWTPRSVVLVEASDLVREDAYRAFATSRQRGVLLARAMKETDRLVGALLEKVDLSRDMVVVVGPAHAENRPGLTLAALHAPGVPAGLLRSATTRHDGFVQLFDVAPTILDRLGITPPDSMEGRPFEAIASGRSLASRASMLARANHEAAFRDTQTPVVAKVYVWTSIAFVGIAAIVLSIPGRRCRRALEWAALALLVFLPVTFLAGLVRFDTLGAGPYWLFLVGVSIAIAGGLRLLRAWAYDAVLGALAFVVALLTVDVVAGGRLQFNTALGYSPIVAGRFQGMGNLAYSMYAAAGMLLAGLLVHRLGGVRRPDGTRRRAVLAVVIALLVVVIAVDGLPPWGADVGGVLSLLPAAGVLVMVLSGLRVRWRAVAAWLGGAAAAVVALGFLDLARPADQRTHLGRLFEKVRSGDLSGFATVIERKLHENLSVITSYWLFLVPVTIAFVAFLALGPRRRLSGLVAQVPELRAALAGLVVVAALGLALNDSGVAIPGIMLAMLDATLVYLVAREPDDEMPPDLAAWEVREPLRQPSKLA